MAAVESEWQARQSLSLGFCPARAVQAKKISDKAIEWTRMYLGMFTPLRRRLGALTRSDLSHIGNRQMRLLSAFLSLCDKGYELKLIPFFKAR